jgi:hypothetical protein
VGQDTIQYAFESSKNAPLSPKGESSCSSKPQTPRYSLSEASEDTDGLERIAEEIGMETIRIVHAEYEFPIDKIYDVSILEERKGKDGVTRGGDVREELKLDQKIEEVLKNAKLEFGVSPQK